MSPAVSVNPEAPGRSPQKLRVLIADDDRDEVLTLRSLIEDEGHEVLGLYRGGDVLDAVRDFGPDVVLLDIGMPDRNGYEVVEALRAHFAGRDIRYVALTGFGGAEDRDRAMDSGFDSFIVKPLQSSPP